jgi:hypothetical protein
LYRQCLKACRDKYKIPFSRVPINNFGPMVSAPAGCWTAIGGYDESIVWATSASTVHADAAKRLQLFVRKRFLTLPRISAVHPWHPIGFAAANRGSNPEVRRFMQIQKQMTVWSESNGGHDWRSRYRHFTKALSDEQQLIDSVIACDRQCMEDWADDELLKRDTKEVRSWVTREQRWGLLGVPRNLLKLLVYRDL